MTQRALSKHSESTQSTQRILKEQSESNQRERDQSDFVIPSEPKILRLVFKVVFFFIIVILYNNAKIQ